VELTYDMNVVVDKQNTLLATNIRQSWSIRHMIVYALTAVGRIAVTRNKGIGSADRDNRL
jgi:hypothetical protein